MSAGILEKVGDFRKGVPKILNSRRLRGGRKKLLCGKRAIISPLNMQKKNFEKIQNLSSYLKKRGGH